MVTEDTQRENRHGTVRAWRLWLVYWELLAGARPIQKPSVSQTMGLYKYLLVLVGFRNIVYKNPMNRIVTIKRYIR